MENMKHDPDDDDDTHVCIKCNKTINGLHNYVEHRKNRNCASLKNVTTSSTLEKGKLCFQLNFDTTIRTNTNDVNDNEKHSTPLAINDKTIRPTTPNATSTDTSKSLAEPYDSYNYDLGADIFFSSLELQSSKHIRPTQIPLSTTSSKPAIAPNRIHMTRKTTAAILAHHDHDDMWMGAPTVSDEKLMKVVSDISGPKKADSIFDTSGNGTIMTSSRCGNPGGTPSRVVNFSPNEFSEQHYADEVDDEEEDPVGGHDDDENDEDFNVPPRNFTGGKWKAGSIDQHRNASQNQWNVDRTDLDGWEMLNDDHTDDFNPPPSYTKGKWVPGTKIIKLDYKPDLEPGRIFTDQYWCSTCNRKLANRMFYDRHLKSNLHIKRSQPETELEEAARPLPRINDTTKRAIKPSQYLDNKIYDVTVQQQMALDIPKSIDISEAYIKLENPEEPTDKVKKRKRRKYFVKCEVCKTRLPKYLLGKHLISHYHYRRMVKTPHSYAVILTNMHKIVTQSPYQCGPCRFYANTEEQFMRHWSSKEHSDTVEGPPLGRFWCSFCKFECEDNHQMRRHLSDEDHQEVVMAINRSVPIVIRKRTIIACEKCGQEFQYNVELIRHSRYCTMALLGTASNNYQSKYHCDRCDKLFKSKRAVQKHQEKRHSTKMYYCSFCSKNFSTNLAAQKHRRTAEHKVIVARSKMGKSKEKSINLRRKCGVCSEIQPDILQLREHLETKHPDDKSSCSYCGKSFTLSQELSRHVRDNICRKTIIEYDTDTIASTSLADINFVSEDTAPEQSKRIQILEDKTEALTPFEPSSADQKNWQCNLCPFQSTVEAELLFHEIAHHSTDNTDKNHIICPMCSKKFLKSSLRYHLRQHTNERPYECNYCQIRFTRKSNLKDHIENVHAKKKTKCDNMNIDSITFACQVCDKKFKKKHVLEQHYHCHRDKIATSKTYPCTWKNCSFFGRCQAELRNHEVRHSNVSNYYCSTANCNYKGKSLTLLKRHTKRHAANESTTSSAETPKSRYQCAECSFQTKNPTHLKRHQKIHSDRKPLKCPYCEYTCKYLDNLRKHVLSTGKHPGKFMYECTNCPDDGTRFFSNNTKDYKDHLLFVHNEIN